MKLWFRRHKKAAYLGLLILPMTEDLSPAIALATGLRQSAVRAQVYTENKKFKQRISYADKLGIPYVVFLGEDEIAQNKVTLKNMRTGDQKLLPADEAREVILRFLDQDGAVSPIREPESGAADSYK